MAIKDFGFYIERVNFRTTLVAFSTIIMGILTVYFSTFVSPGGWQKTVESLGSLLIVTGAIAFLWELWIKRAFLDEILAKTGISKELSFAGIIKITDVFHQDIDWRSYFNSVNKLDIFFAYGRTWRNSHTEELRRLASKRGARIRVVLPDPESEETVTELSRRFGYKTENLIELIKEARTFFFVIAVRLDSRRSGN